MRNWAGNLEYRAARVHYPGSVDEVRRLAGDLKRVKALGTRHSFSDAADTEGDLISLRRMDSVLALDMNREQPTVTVEGGITYGKLCEHLDREGYALHNLASLPHISVAGACATSTHGSGVRNGSLSTAVRAMQVVTASGDLVEFSRDLDSDAFEGAVVGLGGLGVVTQITLDVMPRFEMRQNAFEFLPMMQTQEEFDAVVSAAYSVSLFTDWRAPRFNQVWFKSLVSEGLSIAVPEASPATRDLHPLIEISAVNCTAQMGVAGPWHERLPHFRMQFTPSSGEELQTEYFVQHEDAVAAIAAIYAIREVIAPLVQITEVREISADRLWMSPSYGRNSVALHFTWVKNSAGVMKVLPVVEQALAPFSPRPHWGKLFTMGSEEIAERYERFPDFTALLRRYDPDGKFRNGFMERCGV